jgi:glycosyltransferase involved in cell wall biosynthesis
MRVSLVMTCRSMGGLQQSLVPYALALKSRGHTVQIVARRGADILVEVRQRGLADDTCLLGGGWRLLWRLQTRELRRTLLEFAPDIVVGFAQKGFFEAARAMRGLDVPVVTRVGTMQARRQSRFGGADGWLATTDEMKQSLTGLGFPAQRVFVVPNFLADPVAPGSGADHADVPLIGSMARFVRRKGLHVLIEAVALLKRRGVRVRCDIAGGGRVRAELARQIETLDAGDCIRLVGWLASEGKTEFLAGLELFVCPSLDEPFGFVYLEAMRMGKPVITAPTVGARHIFPGREGAVFVPFSDPVALADAIAALLGDAPRRAALGARAAEIYRERFSLEAGAGNLGDALVALQAAGRR